MGKTVSPKFTPFLDPTNGMTISSTPSVQSPHLDCIYQYGEGGRGDGGHKMTKGVVVVRVIYNVR